MHLGYYLSVVCDKKVRRHCVDIYMKSFIHSIGMCRMRRFLAVLRRQFHSSLLYTLSFHPIPTTSFPSSLTSSCHLFLGIPSQPCSF